jgi:lipoate-protein ligase B
VCGDLSPFGQITPCGISNVAMTSIKKETGKDVTVPAAAVMMEKLAAQRIGHLQITAPEPLRL